MINYGTPKFGSSYGHNGPTPYVTVMGDNHRKVRAAALRLAAEAEERSGGERWVVRTGDQRSQGGGLISLAVELELFHGTDQEGARGLAVLIAAVAALPPAPAEQAAKPITDAVTRDGRAYTAEHGPKGWTVYNSLGRSITRLYLSDTAQAKLFAQIPTLSGTEVEPALRAVHKAHRP